MISTKSMFGIVILCLGILYLGYIPVQSDFLSISLGYVISFLAYFWLIFMIDNQGPNPQQFKWLITLVPLGLVFSSPNLSDDIYRFIWDGYCTLSGVSPYAYIPRDIPIGLVDGISPSLFDQLNSPDYFSIYPTFSQFLFAAMVAMSDNIYTQSICLKLVYLLTHVLGGIAIFKVLGHRRIPHTNLYLYYLNPLVLVEGIGNLHAEINMVSFLFIALWFWNLKRDWWAALMVSIAINIKLIPIFLLGYFLVRYMSSRKLGFLFKVGFLTFIMFIPVIYGLVSGGFLDSLDLYFRKFEFNGSVYYLLRMIGMWTSGYNLIAYLGPILFLIFVGLAFLKWVKERERSGIVHFFQTCEFVLVTYLLVSTIIHPWYLIPLLGLNVVLKRRYLLAWSFLITFTYINYSYVPYFENLWIVFFEYAIVAIIALFEYNYSKRPLAQPCTTNIK